MSPAIGTNTNNVQTTTPSTPTSDEECNDDRSLTKNLTKTFDSRADSIVDNSINNDYPNGTGTTSEDNVCNTVAQPGSGNYSDDDDTNLNMKSLSSSVAVPPSSSRDRRRLYWILALVTVILIVTVVVLIPTVFVQSNDSTQTTSSNLSDNLNIEPKPATTPTVSSPNKSSSSSNAASKPTHPTKNPAVPTPVPTLQPVVTTESPTVYVPPTPLQEKVWTILTSIVPDPTLLNDTESIEYQVYKWMVTPYYPTTSNNSSNITISDPPFLESLLQVDANGNITVDINEYITNKIYQRYNLALLEALWHSNTTTATTTTSTSNTTSLNTTTSMNTTTSFNNSSTSNSTGKGDRELQQQQQQPASVLFKSADVTKDECSWIGITCSNVTVHDTNNQQRTIDVVTKIVWRNMELSGPLPDILLNLPYVTYLDLTSNAISGSIPDFIYENMTDLTHLVLHENQITGTISSKIHDLKKLEKLFLSSNQMNGTIPTEFGDDPSVTNNYRPLRHLVLFNNSFTGPLPSPFNLKKLFYLDLGYNKLTGTIPEDWIVGGTSLSRIQALYLDHNQLNGTIPKTLPRLGDGRMSDIHLQNNYFTGEYTFNTTYRTKFFLQVIEIQNNNLTGSLDNTTCGMSFYSGGQLVVIGGECSICSCPTLCQHCAQY